MDTIKTVRDELNALKSELSFLKQPKIGKSHFDSLRIFTLEQEIKVLQEKLVELKNNL